MTYLIIANACVWLGVGGYLFLLARQQAVLARRVQHLEILDGNE